MRGNRLGMVGLMGWGMVAGVLGQQPAGRQVVEAAEQTLLSLGMEEIRVAQTDSVCTIAYEDNIYRGTYRGLAAVIEALRSLPETEQAAAYELVV